MAVDRRITEGYDFIKMNGGDTMAHMDSDMTEGQIWRHLLRFSIPMAIGLLFQQLYNTVDTLVVGRFVGQQAQAAVGSTGAIINTVVGFCAGLAIGASVVISQRYGAHDQKGLHRAVHTTIALTFLLSLLATVVGQLIIDPMLRFMQTPEDVLAESRTYLSIYFAGVSGILFYNIGSGILQAVGDSRHPLLFLIISALLNTVLDLVFVLAFGMGVEGVAYATILAQIVSALLILAMLTRSEGGYGIRWRDVRIDRESLSMILKIGLPSSIQSAITAFSNVFVQSYINYFGSACMAGFGVYNKIDAFALIPVQSISMASTTFVGQNWGAGQPKRARDGIRTATIMSLSATAALGAMVFLLAQPLMGFFSREPEVIQYGIRFIRIVTPFYVTICFNQIYAGALRGVGDATMPTIIMLASFVVFRQIYLAVTKALGAGFIAVALAYPVGWIMCSSLLILRYSRSVLVRGGGR